MEQGIIWKRKQELWCELEAIVSVKDIYSQNQNWGMKLLMERGRMEKRQSLGKHLHVRTAGDKEARGKPGKESGIKAKRGGSFPGIETDQLMHFGVSKGYQD